MKLLNVKTIASDIDGTLKLVRFNLPEGTLYVIEYKKSCAFFLDAESVIDAYVGILEGQGGL